MEVERNLQKWSLSGESLSLENRLVLELTKSCIYICVYMYIFNCAR